MSAKTSAIIAWALGVGLCSSAHAGASGILMDALSTSGTSGVNLNTSSSAESFVTNSSGLVGDVELYLEEAAGSTTGSIIITIHSTTSGKPGALVDTLQTLTESQIPSSAPTLFDFYNITLAAALSPNAEYWIEVSKAANSGPISTDAFTTAPGNIVSGTVSTGNAAGDTAYSLNGNSALTTKLLTDCVSSDNSCDAGNPALALYSFNETSAPEPATFAIIGAGLTGLGWVRRRRGTRT